MKKVLFLHGNGGTYRDGDPLKRTLQEGTGERVLFFAPDLNQGPALVDYLDGAEWVAVAHSWGCYYLLSQWLELAPKIRKVILVNPYLVQENPLSAPVQWLLKTPILGDLLLKANHTKQKDVFLQKMLSPVLEADLPYGIELQQQLQDFSLWEQAARNKIQQQKQPLALVPMMGRPLVALVGMKDQVARNDLQLEALRSLFPEAVVEKRENAGHGMIWTHLTDIIKEIER